MEHLDGEAARESALLGTWQHSNEGTRVRGELTGSTTPSRADLTLKASIDQKMPLSLFK